MSSDKLVKQYRYIGELESEVVKPEKILKKGRYRTHELPDFDRSAVSNSRINRAANIVMAGSSAFAGVDPSYPHPLRNGIDAQPTGRPVTMANSTFESESSRLSKEEQFMAAEKKAAHAAGFQEGRTQGLAEAFARVEKIKTTVEKMMGEMNNSSKRFFEEFETTLTDLSLHLAAKIIGEAAYMMPEVVRANVEKCVSLLAGAGNVTIKINPGDYEVIKELLPNLERKFDGHFSYIIEPDQKISRGGCLIEMDGSVIDGRIETQFLKLKEEMQQLV